MSERASPINPTATAAGLVDLRAPEPGTITLRAIAQGLSQIHRWAGATIRPVSVAQHSLLVLELYRRMYPTAPEGAVYAGLHDAHEYLIGDVTTPTLLLISEGAPGAWGALDAAKARFDAVIFAALGLPFPAAALRGAVAEADALAAHLEWLKLMPTACGPSPFAEVGARWTRILPPIISSAPWPQAAEAFEAAIAAELHRLNWEVV